MVCFVYFKHVFLRYYEGNFAIDEVLLRDAGCKDFSKYRVDQSASENDLMLDFFVSE